MANGHKKDFEKHGSERVLQTIVRVLETTEQNNQKRHTELLAKLTVPPTKLKVSFSFAIGQPKLKTKTKMPLAITITDEQKVNVTLKPVTDAGKPVTLDGAPVWSVTLGDSTIVPAADGLSADLISSDTPGDTQILVSADADLGSGVDTISDTIDLTVVGASAKNLGLVAGTPVLK